VEAAAGDFDRLLIALASDAVDEAVLFGDPARPETRQFVAKRFRLADPGEGAAGDLLDQLVDPGGELCVGLLPVQIMFLSEA
jgi:hypothetical protein